MTSTEYPKINSVFERAERGRFTDAYACPEFEYLADRPWTWSEKIDGVNMRLHVPAGATSGADLTRLIAGRTDNAQIPPKLLHACIDLLAGILNASAFDPDADVVLYGEGYGAGIQKGGMYRPDPSFVLFDVKCGDWWLRRPDVEDVARKLGLDVVPIVDACTLNEAVDHMRSQAAGDGVWITSAWLGARPEGVVGRPAVDLWNRRGERIITKLKFKDFREK